MRHRLKTTLALVALQLCAALPFEAQAAGAGTDVAKSSVRRLAMIKAGQKRRVRRRAPDALTPGVWGGRHIRFEVTERGANVEYDCAHGTVGGQIVVDAGGRFNVEGLHYEERGGPVREGGEASGYRVRLRGRVGGSLMKLTVTRADRREVVGTFDLTRDGEPVLVKCR